MSKTRIHTSPATATFISKYPGQSIENIRDPKSVKESESIQVTENDEEEFSPREFTGNSRRSDTLCEEDLEKLINHKEKPSDVVTGMKRSGSVATALSDTKEASSQTSR